MSRQFFPMVLFGSMEFLWLYRYFVAQWIFCDSMSFMWLDLCCSQASPYDVSELYDTKGVKLNHNKTDCNHKCPQIWCLKLCGCFRGGLRNSRGIISQFFSIPSAIIIIIKLEPNLLWKSICQ